MILAESKLSARIGHPPLTFDDRGQRPAAVGPALADSLRNGRLVQCTAAWVMFETGRSFDLVARYGAPNENPAPDGESHQIQTSHESSGLTTRNNSMKGECC